MYASSRARSESATVPSPLSVRPPPGFGATRSLLKCRRGWTKSAGRSASTAAGDGRDALPIWPRRRFCPAVCCTALKADSGQT